VNTRSLFRDDFIFLMTFCQTDSYRSCIRLTLFSLLLCLVEATSASALKGVGNFDPSSPGKIGPVGPQYAPVVNAPQDFTINSRGTTQVGLRWWNKGAPETRISRSVNGGQWTTIKTYGQLPVDAYIDFQDPGATINAENCYVVTVSDGVNSFSSLSTPQRCAFTRDGRDLPVHRLQLRLRTPSVSGAGTDDDVEIRLQTPSWIVPTVTNWSPAGNSTWIDSTEDDFEGGSNHTYDLMLTNVSQVSDITMITVSKTGDDDMCIAELELLIDGQPAFQRTFGDQAATCAWITAGNVLSITFNELRTSVAWNNLSLPPFTGIDGAGLRSVVQTIFAHMLHGQGELRNGGITLSSRTSETRLHMVIPIVVYDVSWGEIDLGDVDSNVYFDLVITPVVENGIPKAEISVENPNADSKDLLGYLLPIIGWAILYETSETIEDKLADINPFDVDSSPVPGTHVCFTPNAGLGLCFDSSLRQRQFTPRTPSLEVLQ
jgi:hypothetical protein